jgi:excisionase family DNA binding protein
VADPLPHAAGEWLSLDEACRALGIHPATLRRWANQGSISTFVTPGGHRRFRRADVERFEEEHRQSGQSLPPAQWTDQVVASAHQEVVRQQFAAVYDDADRDAQRHLGRRLLGAIVRHAAATVEDAGILTEARGIGEQYAEIGLKHQQSLVDMLRVMGLFKAALLEGALPRPEAARARPDGRLLLRIGGLLDEVQMGVVGAYESRWRG